MIVKQFRNIRITIFPAKFIKDLLKTVLIFGCEIQYGITEYLLCFSNKETVNKLMSVRNPCILEYL